ncbi:MAG TPA: sigma-54-dependent Fis family transcriptional regulator, partial [bacterium]|nr:sigma-54-dependent Fis family transcriptional regulator [bacterium]
TWPGMRTIALKDLTEAQTRRLIRNALLDRAPEKKEEDRIVRACGGRPLLVLDYLRHRGESVPSDFSQAARAKAERLSAPARRLLSFVAAHTEPPETMWMEKLEFTPDDLADARIELQSEGILAPAAGEGRLHLRHPSLKAAYRSALTAETLAEAHRAWIAALTPEAESGAPSRNAALIAEHALGAGDSPTARRFGLSAVEHYSRTGQWARVADFCGRLAAIAETPMDRAIVHAYEAPVFYRLGRYDDALRAYDRWYANKPDDGTGVETVKYRYLTGLTLTTAGRKDQALQRLKECLEAGDDAKHAHHRPFHAQAHILLSTLETGEDRILEHLSRASELAAGQPLLLGEIERRMGEQQQRLGRDEAALRHFHVSAARYREGGSPQAEATSFNGIAMSLRWLGRLKDSLEEIGTAVRLSEEGGEILQTARYRENRALILMDLGRYGEAAAEREKARDALDSFGTDLDRSLLKDHDAWMDAWLGRSTPEALESLKAIRRQRAPSPDPVRLEETLASIGALESPELRADLHARLAEALGAAGLDRIALSLRNAAFLELENIRRQLPEELKMDFEKRPDLKKLNESLGELLPKAAPASGGGVKGQISASRFRQFCAINRQMAMKSDMGEILDRVIDAAIEITGAERGFILLKEVKASKSPIAGFDVKVARNLNREMLKGGDFELSLSLVKQAIDKAAYVLTDDALSDPRFSEKKSVMDYRLRSVLVVPLEEEGKVFGVIYLDHRYQPDCFSEEDLALLNALAAQASLAIQKARLIDELTRSRDKLALEVKDQAEQIEAMSEELTKKRGELRYGYEEIVGQSPAMLKVFQVLDDVSETTIPVWIHGESGTGKELIARSLHVNSPRAKGPFVAENVSAIPETLLESELFGHKKGSFTHADRDRVGLFEQASGGTLFLDEVADMSLAMQAKLLRVLQEGEVRPVGSSKKVKIDVRLVTASNRDLDRMVQEGKFRQDLFFRINGLTINLPSLRNRKEDIPLLVRHFSKRIAKEFNLPEAEVTDRALKSLMAHSWPGNVRELEAVIRNALLFAKGKPIGPDHLTIKASSMAAAPVTGTDRPAPATAEDVAHRNLVVTTLRKHHLNKEETAKELKVSLRTLYTWMEKHGIPKKKALLAQFVESA